MRIGEICKLTDLSKDTVRYYEKRGLISPTVSNSMFNNYKDYSEEDLSRLHIIKRSKTMGFTLKEIGNYLDMVSNDQLTCNNMLGVMNSKIYQIESKIKELQEMKHALMLKILSSKKLCSPINNAITCQARI